MGYLFLCENRTYRQAYNFFMYSLSYRIALPVPFAVGFLLVWGYRIMNKCLNSSILKIVLETLPPSHTHNKKMPNVRILIAYDWKLYFRVYYLASVSKGNCSPPVVIIIEISKLYR